MLNIVYILIFGLFCISLFGILVFKNRIKRLIFLGLMQTSVIMLYVCAGYKNGSFSAPIYKDGNIIDYANPVPTVLMLTAIVVGIAVSSVGLAIIIKINKKD